MRVAPRPTDIDVIIGQRGPIAPHDMCGGLAVPIVIVVSIGISRVGVRFDAGAGGLNTSVKSVWIRFRKYGAPTGNITMGIRKASDDSLVTIGTWPVGTEQSFVVRLRSNTYQMVHNDVVSVEFPSNATNDLEIPTSTTQDNPTGYTGRQHNGTAWVNTTNPPAIIIKG